MKRLVLSAFIMISLAVLSVISTVDFYEVKTELRRGLSLAGEYAENGETERAAEIAELMLDEWQDEEKHLLRYLNHSDIDAVSEVLTKLPFLLRDPYSQGLAKGEINNLYNYIEHVWEAEIPYPKSIM